MTIDVVPGKYVVAVSGGVDSVVLLDMLYSNFHNQNSRFQFIVAHFDHGIRPNSVEDRIFVEKLTRGYGLQFEYDREELGPEASEDLARKRRYFFLNKVKNQYKADKIITAHHLDDVIETACINLIRGTGRIGLAPMSGLDVLRPLLNFEKKQIVSYAQDKKLIWVEDETNQSQKYLRNRVRQKLSKVDRRTMSSIKEKIAKSYKQNAEINYHVEQVFEYLKASENSIDRQKFIALPYKVSCELLSHWLRKNQISFDKKLIEKLVRDVKTGQNGSSFDVSKTHKIILDNKQISLVGTVSV